MQASFTSHHTVLSSGIKLHHTQWGKPDAQPVVCVHGLTRNARDFDALALALSENYCVYCVDVMGRGESDWATDPTQYALPTYAAQQLEWLNLNGLTQPHWVGTSMGGLIAMTLQLIAPNRFEKLVLNDVGPVIETVALQRIAQYIGAQQSFASREAAQSYARVVFASFGAKAESEWGQLTDHYFVDSNKGDGSVHIHYDPAIATVTKQSVAAMKPKSTQAAQAALWASVKSLSHPCLVLRGEHSDLLSAQTVADMLACNPLIEAQTIADCGHAPHLLDAQQTDLIKDFLLSNSSFL